MGRAKQIYIHLGAHRTGTSSFQMCLHQNRDAIGAAGFDLAYPGRDGIVSGDLALRLPSPRHGWVQQAKFTARVMRKIAFHSPDPTRPLILSEENILGKMIHFFGGQFYPAANARFDALKAGLGGAEIAGVLLVVRPYDELYRSAYRKRAEDQQVGPFAQAAPHLMEMDRGWPELVELIAATLAPVRLHVVSYGARGTSAALLQRLVPELAQMPLEEPTRRVNLSASDAALKALQACYMEGQTLDPAQRRAVMERYDNQVDEPSLTPFSEAQISALRTRYLEDLDLIQNMKNTLLTR